MGYLVGELALFLKLGVDLEVVYSDNHVIAALVYSDPPESVWLLIAVYGSSYVAKRRSFWSFLENLICSFSGLWLIIRDLNSIVKKSEKRGGSSSGLSSSSSFLNFVSNTRAIDLGFNGPRFTCSN